MELNAILDKLKKAGPGAWQVKVTYKKPLELSAKAIKAGIDPEKCFRINTRLCRVNIDYANTAQGKASKAAKALKFEEDPMMKKFTYAFNHSDVPGEEKLVLYSKKSGLPAIILYSGNALSPDDTKYFFDDSQITYADLNDLYDNKVVTKSALGHEGGHDGYFQIYADKIQDIELTGKNLDAEVDAEEIAVEPEEQTTITEAAEISHTYEMSTMAFDNLHKNLVNAPNKVAKIFFSDRIVPPVYKIVDATEVDPDADDYVMIASADSTLDEINNELKKFAPEDDHLHNVGEDIISNVKEPFSYFKMSLPKYNALKNGLGEGGRALILVGIDGVLSSRVLNDEEDGFNHGDKFDGKYVVCVVTKEHGELSISIDEIIEAINNLKEIATQDRIEHEQQLINDEIDDAYAKVTPQETSYDSRFVSMTKKGRV